MSHRLNLSFICLRGKKRRGGLPPKHMMRFVRRVKRWPTDTKPYTRFRCEHCGYTFNTRVFDQTV